MNLLINTEKYLNHVSMIQNAEQMILLNDKPNLSARPEPFLKWAGGKTQLLKQFEPLFPCKFHRYYEPFVGSGAVFFHLRPLRAVLSDSNPNLIAVYQHMQAHLDQLLSLLYEIRSTYHALSPQQQEQEYYRVREMYNTLPSGYVQNSALLIFLNKIGYNCV